MEQNVAVATEPTTSTCWRGRLGVALTTKHAAAGSRDAVVEPPIPRTVLFCLRRDARRDRAAGRARRGGQKSRHTTGPVAIAKRGEADAGVPRVGGTGRTQLEPTRLPTDRHGVAVRHDAGEVAETGRRQSTRLWSTSPMCRCARRNPGRAVTVSVARRTWVISGPNGDGQDVR